ncbi:hypothetical protein EDD85DRAFT_945197 [Armillaria nabsnona]|nr:hypothetical protein EDD85DRAFT_945197 [Armillaria nabsnona]
MANASLFEAGFIYTNVTALAAHVDDKTLKLVEGILEAEELALMVNNTNAIDISLLYGDSGVSTHFIQNRDCFFHYLPLSETSGTSSKAGASLNIHGIGTVVLKSSVLGVQNVFMLSKALHCPDVSANLISIS